MTNSVSTITFIGNENIRLALDQNCLEKSNSFALPLHEYNWKHHLEFWQRYYQIEDEMALFLRVNSNCKLTLKLFFSNKLLFLTTSDANMILKMMFDLKSDGSKWDVNGYLLIVINLRSNEKYLIALPFGDESHIL